MTKTNSHSRQSRKLMFSVPKPESSSEEVLTQEVDIRETLKKTYSEEFKALEQEVWQKHYDELYKSIESDLQDKFAKDLKAESDRVDDQISTLTKQAEIVEVLAERLNELITDIAKANEKAVVELTMKAFYKLVGDDALYDKLIAQAVKQAVEKISSGEKLRVYLSRYDLSVVESVFENNTMIELLLGSSLKKGEIRIDTGFSVYDMGLIHQVEQIKQALVSAVTGNDDDN